MLFLYSMNSRDARAFDVIHVTNELASGKIGGVGTVVENLAEGLRKLSWRALWFLVRDEAEPSPPPYEAMGGVAVATGTIEELRHYWAPILHIHCYEPQEKLLEICRERASLYTIHSLLRWEARSNDIDLSTSIRWQEQLIAAVDRVVVVSSAERDAYTELGYLVVNPLVSVVHNGVRRSGAFYSPRGVKTIGFCGRLVPRKRPEYPQIILKEPRFRACRTLIAGRGFSAYARDLLVREKLDGRVTYLGWCTGSRLEAFFDQIDVLAVPSTYEPFGLVSLEAMSRGIPVVCPRSGGLVEVLGDHAYWYEDATFEGFTSAMTRWIDSSPLERDTMARAAFRRYHNGFSDLHMAHAYGELYTELTQRA
jgi:glycosyltransferase involved in cell wall biosynthesis